MKLATGLVPILVLLLLFTACGSGTEGGGGGGEELNVPETPSTPLLKYQFEKGEKLHYLYSTDQTLKMAMGDITQEMIFNITMDVNEVLPDGAGKMTYTYERARFKGTNPVMGSAEYDSKAENAEEQAQNPMVISAAALDGAKLDLTRHPDGKISDLTGMTAVLGKILGTTGDDPNAQTTEGMLKEMFSDKAWAKTLEAAALIFEDETAEVGATWTIDRSITMPMMGEFKLNPTFTFDATEERDGVMVARISAASVLDQNSFTPAPADESNPMSAMLASMKISSGEWKGTFEFDMTNGVVLMNRSDLKMSLEMMGMQMDGNTVITEMFLPEGEEE
jgi:uncharacterized protein DUF6263